MDLVFDPDPARSSSVQYPLRALSAVGHASAACSESAALLRFILPRDVGSAVGTFGFQAYSDAELLSSTGIVAGYPTDKPVGTPWQATGRIASVDGLRVYYDTDTEGGQSGAPVFHVVQGQPYALAMHGYGGWSTNFGVRINDQVFRRLAEWRAL